MKYSVCTENDAMLGRKVYHLRLYFAECLLRDFRRSCSISKFQPIGRFEFAGCPNYLHAIVERLNAFDKDRAVHEELLASALFRISLIAQHQIHRRVLRSRTCHAAVLALSGKNHTLEFFTKFAKGYWLAGIGRVWAHPHVVIRMAHWAAVAIDPRT